ncbi:MAG: response regulator [Bacteroidales bacterium]|jgi:PAS domain S-box-containing protein
MKKEIKIPAQKSTEILVVEDSITQATQIKHLLESHHYKVTVAHDGNQAINWLSKHKPSLVISDILMPEMNGYELCKKIKSNKNTEDIPVILLTRLYDPEEIIEGLSCGADSFITKPYNEDHLLSNIEKVISDENGTDQKKMPFGVQILFNGEKRFVQAEQQNVIKLMLNIYEGAIYQNERLIQTQEELRLLNERLELLVEERTADLSEEIILSNQIAKELKVSEEKWRTLVTTIPEYIGLVDCEGKFRFLNHYAEGFSEKDTIGKNHLDFIPLEWKEFYQQKFEKCISAQKNQIFEYSAYGDNNAIKTYETCLLPIIHKGKVSNVMAIARDITEHRLAEKALQESEEKYRHIFENVQDVYYETSIDGTILNLSPSISLMSKGQYNQSDLVGKSMYEFYSDPGERQLIVAALKEKGRVPDFEIRLKNRDGSSVPCSISAKISFNAQGHPEKIIGSMRDITLRKKNEEELMKAKEKAEESDRLKTAFLHNISHEIRTPMNAIVGFSALLGEPGIDTQTQQSHIETITQSSNHLLAIISDIIDISNIEANIIKAVKTPINVNKTLKNIYNQFLQKAEEKKTELACKSELSDSDAQILTDGTKLTQILSNLINNALKFTYEGSVNVNCKKTDNFLEFSLSDTGIGIPAEHHARIFDRFYQVENAVSRLYEGTGLGLAISKAYVELLGGNIWLSSEPGKGTSFYFTIPYERQTMTVVPVIEKPADKEFVFPEKKTILVAEDIDSNFDLITYFLSGANIKIIRASNGKEAIELFKADQSIVLILMDIKMPEINGLEATRQIKLLKRKVVVIALTAYANSGDEERILAAGCDSYLSKPVNKKSLLEKMADYIIF